MLYFLNAPSRPKPWQIAPLRRRAIVIGAGRTGISAAYHLGQQSLLLEQRSGLADECSNDGPVGADRDWFMGDKDFSADRQRPGLSSVERKALFISCSSTGQARADESALIHVARWQPPEFSHSAIDATRRQPASVHALVPLLRGEVRLGAQVVRISPSEHLLDLADGTRFIYDKLLSTVSLSALLRMVLHELPPHVRRDESLRYWLSEHDVESGDRVTQLSYGDIDELAAGKRIADQFSLALANKFHRQGPAFPRDRLFEPRLVRSRGAPASP
jgi:hypothetical protein